MKIKNLILILILTGAWITWTSPANSCSCVGITPAQAFNGSDVVFAGIVIKTESIQEQRDSSGNTIFIRDIVAHIRVTNIWKGQAGAEVLVKTGGSEAGCGIGFRPNLEFLVYARKVAKADMLRTSLCDRTTPLVLATIQKEMELWIPDEKPENADFDHNGKVDFTDFILFVSAYGSADARFDIYPDGQVNFSDFLKFAQWYGRTVASD